MLSAVYVNQTNLNLILSKKKGGASRGPAKNFVQSVRITRMISPSDAVDLGRPCNSLFEFQVVHRYVFIVVCNFV